MQYRVNPKNNEEISALGFGCMRFHKDEREVERQIRYAIEQGVNYFDTAYMYGNSEAILGRILSKDGLREKVKIATKMPYYMVRKNQDFNRFFNTELERLQTDYIDYYLMHMVTDLKSWRGLCDLGIREWVAEKKSSGRIRNIGFSFHGVQSEFFALLDDYDWDFCMIQFNYLDEYVQAGKAGLEYAGSKGIPVIVMEPLRGGTLVQKLPKEALDLLNHAPVKRSPADWGLRWVLNHPQVLCVLSGMGTRQMVEENIATASDAYPDKLTEEELTLYTGVRDAIRAATKVSCTGCGYCMPCPKDVNIPMCFSSLNDTMIKGKIMSLYWYILMTAEHNASLCVQCGKCESHCPQAIPIREKMKQVQRELEGFPYKPMRFILERVLNKV
ncbi:aldo/keto reductase [Brucepastera parasyntrophica]|uniref:aldo/keto reductase n=1 Tax=Brucepastera parasyntrophica TaxID=2880008 RepID=UPI00210E6B4F|nr:aldo/keto reductase [Brucepastera parasyntrophica]ULQ59747.1 aldo/keto reductase [Brucepastera parasyntrophica]